MYGKLCLVNNFRNGFEKVELKGEIEKQREDTTNRESPVYIEVLRKGGEFEKIKLLY